MGYLESSNDVIENFVVELQNDTIMQVVSYKE